MKRPRLNILRTFEAAARHLSFSKAADELNITQAAVSQQIRQLETYLGGNLFIRHNRRLSLASTGRAYYDGVHEALDRLDTITYQLFPDRPHQVVVIRCTSSVALLWLAPNMRDFHAQHPDIDLQIRTQDFEGELGVASNVDLEVFVSGKPDHDPHTKPLFHSVITPVASAKYIGARNVRRPRDILDCELIHILGYEDDWHRWFRTYDLDSASIPRGLTADSSLFAIDAALRGDGLFLGRRPFINAYLEAGDLVEVFEYPHHLHANYYMRELTSTSNTRNKSKVAFWLLELAEKYAEVQ
ncbi:MAG: LysR family transcriptional regulator [Paracoccaceae bacterium]|jgi:LysR family glycine cleavage system transcriptional activator